MKKEIIELIAQFLQRVDIKGSEVQAFNVVMQSLSEELKLLDEKPKVEKKESK